MASAARARDGAGTKRRPIASATSTANAISGRLPRYAKWSATHEKRCGYTGTKPSAGASVTALANTRRIGAQLSRRRVNHSTSTSTAMLPAPIQLTTARGSSSQRGYTNDPRERVAVRAASP